MSFEIYHQTGWRYKWNLESLERDGTGDGVILSPRHIALEEVEGLAENIKAKAIFDPQFFLPNFPKGSLSSYDFFPDIIAAGFDTNQFAGNQAIESSQKCVAFQNNNNFRYVVIPTRHTSGMPSTFIPQQQELFVEPYLSAISEQGSTKKIVLQLVLNDSMIKDAEYSAEILNWVTGIPEIGGVYIIVEVIRRSKQIKDIDFLYSLLHFIHALSSLNKLSVILGYLNIEALLLSIASPHIVTIGSYENTRMFDIRNFEKAEEDKQIRGPTPRHYITKLMQSVDNRYIGSISASSPEGTDIFDTNEYQAEMFQPSFNWHFQKPQLYKHYFLELSNQLRGISVLEGKSRYEKVCDIIENALDYYSAMSDVVFDADSDGSHLPIWLTAAHRFAKEIGWR